MMIIRIDENEASAHLAEAFNPPVINSAQDEDAFYEEWLKARDLLKSLLDEFGDFDPYGDKDFYVGENTGFSRGIGVFLTSKEMLNHNLILATQSLLESLPEVYEVDFSIETMEATFDIFVSKDAVNAYCPEEILSRLCRGI